tara:strand:+ start:61 stop:573 length:513 start_codon:yes stop_codon:yes gene_type:complete
MATRKEVAEHLFMSVQQIGNLITKGVFKPKTGPNPLDLDHSRRDYIQYLQKKAKYYLKDGTGDITEEKTKLTAAQARKAQLEVAVIEGKLIPTDQVENTWVSYISNCRAKLLTIPSKITHLVMSTEDSKDIEKIIKNEINEALSELANDPIPEEYKENTVYDQKDLESTS